MLAFNLMGQNLRIEHNEGTVRKANHCFVFLCMFLCVFKNCVLISMCL